MDWLACFSLQEQTTLFDNFFTRAPLSEALSALVLGLSVNDVSEDEDGDFAAGNLSAACAQSERSRFESWPLRQSLDAFLDSVSILDVFKRLSSLSGTKFVIDFCKFLFIYFLTAFIYLLLLFLQFFLNIFTQMLEKV